MKETLFRQAARSAGTKAAQGVLLAILCLLLNGCRHRQMPPTLPPPILQTPDKPPPTPASPTMEAPPPDTLSTAPAVKVTEAKPKRRSRKSPAKTPPSVEIAAITPPPVASPASSSPLGKLSTGGDANPKSQHEANELVSSSEKRLETLMKTKAGQQEAQTREVRHFLQQAREALATGDAEGAKTLATKAKLLMDDLEKWAQQ